MDPDLRRHDDPIVADVKAAWHKMLVQRSDYASPVPWLLRLHIRPIDQGEPATAFACAR